MTSLRNGAALMAALATLCLSAAAGAADAERGAALYEQRCAGCHSLDASRIGPSHRGVIGRKAGSVAGFAYSPAVKASDVVWTDETLDRWLENPQAVIPGQRMNFRIGDPSIRADIIAFLKNQKP